MGLKWVVTREEKEGDQLQCGGNGERSSEQHPTFLIKTDDDVFIEIFHLEEFVSAIYGKNPR